MYTTTRAYSSSLRLSIPELCRLGIYAEDSLGVKVRLTRPNPSGATSTNQTRVSALHALVVLHCYRQGFTHAIAPVI
jgi:hypothetical protein